MDRRLVFVTGGTGFLGQHLVSQLVEAGYLVRLFVRETSNIDWLSPDWPVELVQGDVTDEASVLRGIYGCKYVVHAAGVFRFWGEHEWFDSVNLIGTQNVVKAAIKHDIRRLVYISTVAVVGNPEAGVLITENTDCHPQDSYQHSKLAAEKYLSQYKATLPYIILRPGAFYGPGGRYAFNRLFVEEPMRGWRVKIDGGRRLTFPVFVPDVARMIISALNKGVVGEIYNIADYSITHNEVNNIVSNILNISRWRLSVPRRLMMLLAGVMEIISKLTRKEPFYPLNLQYYVFNDWYVDHSKAGRDLLFIPTSMEDGLRETVEWFLEQGK